MSVYPKSNPNQPDLLEGLPIIFRATVLTPVTGAVVVEVREHIGAEGVIYMTLMDPHTLDLCKTFRVLEDSLMTTIHCVANNLPFKGFELTKTGGFVGLEKA